MHSYALTTQQLGITERKAQQPLLRLENTRGAQQGSSPAGRLPQNPGTAAHRHSPAIIPPARGRPGAAGSGPSLGSGAAPRDGGRAGVSLPLRAALRNPFREEGGGRRHTAAGPLLGVAPRTCSPVPGRLGGPCPATPLSGLGAGALAATAGRGRQHGGVSGGGSAPQQQRRQRSLPPPPALRAARLCRAALGGSRSSRPAAERRLRPAGCGYNGASAPIIIPHYSGAGERLLGRCPRLGPAPCGPAGCGCGGCSARPGRAGRRQVPVTAGGRWRARSRRRGRSRSPRDSSPSGPAAEAAAEAASWRWGSRGRRALAPWCSPRG